MSACFIIPPHCPAQLAFPAVRDDIRVLVPVHQLWSRPRQGLHRHLLEDWHSASAGLAVQVQCFPYAATFLAEQIGCGVLLWSLQCLFHSWELFLSVSMFMDVEVDISASCPLLITTLFLLIDPKSATLRHKSFLLYYKLVIRMLLIF